jgi:putative transposase
VLARRKKGSNNRNKQRLVVARIHEKVANSRNDFLHKLTTRLVREKQTDTFAIEDLGVTNMMQNHRLARSIGDAGWGTFRQFLNYKVERAGKNVIAIGRYEPSSKMCSCGELNDNLKLSDRTWTCSCGLTHDRDVLAAQNIKRFALHPQNLVRRDTPEFTLGERSL